MSEVEIINAAELAKFGAYTRCDTPGCDAIHPGDWQSAYNAGWRTDYSRCRRCPPCRAAHPLDVAACGKPLRGQAAGYKAWADGDPEPLTAFLDKKFGTLERPEPAEPHPSQPLPVGDWAITMTFPADATPDEKVEAIMARLEDAWDEEAALDVPAPDDGVDPPAPSTQSPPDGTPGAGTQDDPALD